MRRVYAAQVQHRFDPNKVLYLSGDINYSTVYLIDGKHILTSRTLKWYTSQWPHFMRIHKNSLVNPEHIYSCILASSIEGYLIMKNGARLTIGRRRINEVAIQLGIDRSKNSGKGSYYVNPSEHE
ncbi:LytTR family transcriptional regulator [Spirosoma sp. KCTC 42546]|uniref:LytR/AlgR family response regulator transcription factor n=1 Tax=Spirosoma sp. KCTC 42546 TaxID=2520506 RepID=UPI001158AE47|nr:LytTR family DNA-binding domain-containing protein [Spirosoma sp. KCTC 42546]QDK78698.1 LytTR family transcriptional regulator [Spirosoma sp. KCTC 42546]